MGSGETASARRLLPQLMSLEEPTSTTSLMEVFADPSASRLKSADIPYTHRDSRTLHSRRQDCRGGTLVNSVPHFFPRRERVSPLLY